jgi:predicted DCC family thiol-disulfide oxidoreductase YuxK
VDDRRQGGPILLFDGVCNLCNGFVGFVLTRERGSELRFCAMQSPRGQELLRRFGLPLAEFESVALIEDGAAHLKSEAFLRVLRHLRFPWPWLGWARIVPRPVRDWLYDGIARNRYRLFGRRAACMVPPPRSAGRFLS